MSGSFFSHPIADLHCDTVMAMRRGYDIFERHDTNHIDIPRLKEGGVNIQVFASACNLIDKDGSSRAQVIKSIELLKSEFARQPDLIEICLNKADIQKTIAGGKIAAILAIEGGLALGDDPANLTRFYDMGVRLITIAHEAPTDWCTNWKDTGKGLGGLTRLGLEMIREMNRLGIIIDLSHSSDETVADVLDMADAPIIASHSCARVICGHKRNLTDEQIKAIAANQGLIGVTFVSNFVSEEYRLAYDRFWNSIPKDRLNQLLEVYSSNMTDDLYPKMLHDKFADIIEGECELAELRPSLKHVVDHIDHVVNLVGSEHVAIGSDFDGMTNPPFGLEDCSKMGNLAAELDKRGYRDDEVRKILGQNFLRVFGRICS